MRAIWEGLVRALGFSPAPPVRLTLDEVVPLLRGLHVTLERELGCGQADALMDSFAESLAGGASAESLEAEFRHHLSLCGDCREEFEALIRVLAASAPTPLRDQS